MILVLLALWGLWGLIDVNNLEKAPIRNPADFTPYHDSAGRVVRLSDEHSDPFRKIGRTIQEYVDRYNNAKRDDSKMLLSDHEHYKPITFFPTVLDCLKTSQWSNPQPDLTKIDWDKIDSAAKADVCLFRIASSYDSIAAMQNWCHINDFSPVERHVNYEGNFLLRCGWDIKKRGFFYNIGFFQKILAHGVDLTIEYTMLQKVFNAQINITSE